MGSLLYFFLSVVFFRNADDTPLGLTIHAHQLKNENKMNFRSNKIKNS